MNVLKILLNDKCVLSAETEEDKISVECGCGNDLVEFDFSKINEETKE